MQDDFVDLQDHFVYMQDDFTYLQKDSSYIPSSCFPYSQSFIFYISSIKYHSGHLLRQLAIFYQVLCWLFEKGYKLFIIRLCLLRLYSKPSLAYGKIFRGRLSIR